jgi:hypothetical protein
MSKTKRTSLCTSLHNARRLCIGHLAYRTDTDGIPRPCTNGALMAIIEAKRIRSSMANGNARAGRNGRLDLATLLVSRMRRSSWLVLYCCAAPRARKTFLNCQPEVLKTNPTKLLAITWHSQFPADERAPAGPAFFIDPSESRSRATPFIRQCREWRRLWSRYPRWLIATLQGYKLPATKSIQPATRLTFSSMLYTTPQKESMTVISKSGFLNKCRTQSQTRQQLRTSWMMIASPSIEDSPPSCFYRRDIDDCNYIQFSFVLFCCHVASMPTPGAGGAFGSRTALPSPPRTKTRHCPTC